MIERLASQLGRRDEVPNIELAEMLCQNEDTKGIAEIAANLTNKDKAIANDCIKVLYEIGDRKPYLISQYAEIFLSLVRSRNNRLAWGSMTALATIADLVPETIYESINRVLSAFYEGSVITVDNAVTVLAKLCKNNDAYKQHLLSLLFKHLQECRPKEVAQHAERMSLCIDREDIREFHRVLDSRLAHLSDSQKTRIGKLKRSYPVS
jgi:hypothetical protein